MYLCQLRHSLKQSLETEGSASFPSTLIYMLTSVVCTINLCLLFSFGS
uniref:Uncharacterized protein n=1 Tax=Strix occidentalis caurina TaxID=311401 RepID=A0A8D0FK72_STROC